jgi:hypothetical protein
VGLDRIQSVPYRRLFMMKREKLGNRHPGYEFKGSLRKTSAVETCSKLHIIEDKFS